MIERQIDSPSPKPFGLVVWKALKRRSRAAGANPGPESRTATSFTERRRGSSVWTEVRCYPLSDGGIAAVWNTFEERCREITLGRVGKQLSQR